MPLPASIIPPPAAPSPSAEAPPVVEGEAPAVTVLPPNNAEMAQMLVDGLRPVVRPSRTAADVWQIAREYTERGGLLDLTEDVATFAALEQEIRNSNDFEPRERIELIAKTVNHRVNAKRAHIAVQKDRNSLITHEQFQAFVGDLFEILQRHLGREPHVLRQIGLDMGEVITRMHQRQSAGV